MLTMLVWQHKLKILFYFHVSVVVYGLEHSRSDQTGDCGDHMLQLADLSWLMMYLADQFCCVPVHGVPLNHKSKLSK